MSPLAESAVAETHALHALFTRWFRPDAPGDLTELEAVLAPGFRMVTPDGKAVDRAAVIAAIRDARGARGADFTIAIKAPRVVYETTEAVLLEFIEEQYRQGGITRRLSTALFTPETTAPRGVLWRHLHETWIRDT